MPKRSAAVSPAPVPLTSYIEGQLDKIDKYQFVIDTHPMRHNSESKDIKYKFQNTKTNLARK